MPDLNEPIPTPTPASTSEQPVMPPTTVGLTPAPEPTPTAAIIEPAPVTPAPGDGLGELYKDLSLKNTDRAQTDRDEAFQQTVKALPQIFGQKTPTALKESTPEPAVAPKLAGPTPDQVTNGMLTDAIAGMNDVMGGGLNVPPVILPSNPTPTVAQPEVSPAQAETQTPKKPWWKIW